MTTAAAIPPRAGNLGIGHDRLRRDVVSLIEGGLSDKDAPVRQAAVDVLGTLKSRGSMTKLQLVLDDKSAVVSFA